MAWIYIQDTGELLHDEEHVGYGYSGCGEGKNCPAMQDKHDLGPLPAGGYDIGPPHDTKTHGPFVLPLCPRPVTQMFGRAGFLIHGDSVEHPGTASEGCIILARILRERIAASGDKQLLVKDRNYLNPEAAT